MPLEGLPEILEVTLASILKNTHMSPWQTRSGKDCTQVTLRFSMSAMTVEAVVGCHYKKMTPSQMSRDRNRMNKWWNRMDISVLDNVDKDVDKDSKITMTRDKTSETTQKSLHCGGNQCDQQGAIKMSQIKNNMVNSNDGQMGQAIAVYQVMVMHRQIAVSKT